MKLLQGGFLLFVYSKNGWFYDRFKKKEIEKAKTKGAQKRENVINFTKISEQ